MDFSFNEEQRSLGQTVAGVLTDFSALTAPDPHGECDPDVWQALSELGLFSLLIPEALGGVGLRLVDCALAIEALGAGLAPPLVASTLAASVVIAEHGSADFKAAVLPEIAEGRLKVALAISEAGQVDPLDAACRIEGDQLSGSKIVVQGALNADAFLVVADSSDVPALAFVRRSAGGVIVVPHSTLDPSAGLGSVRFSELNVRPEDWRQSSGGPEYLLDIASTIEAGMVIGIASRMLDTAVAYAKTRQQFGQAIGAFQTIKHRCADMAVAVEAGRATAYYAFWAASTGSADRGQCASAANAYCCEIARDVCNDAIQIHGGMGFTWELGLHRFLRRTRILMASLGSPSWHYGRVFDERLAALSGAPGAQRDAA